jgi:hypothetical protein
MAADRTRLAKGRECPAHRFTRPTDLSVSEPEHRSFWIILAVILFFALAAGGGYYWLNRPEPTSVAHVVPAPSSGSESDSARSDAPSINQTPHLVTGLRSLSSLPTEQPANAPEGPQPAAGSEPDQPQPQLATGLRPKTEQEQSPAPTPPAKVVPPAEPPPVAIPNAKPSRKATHHGSSPGIPQQPSSGPVKF